MRQTVPFMTTYKLIQRLMQNNLQIDCICNEENTYMSIDDLQNANNYEEIKKISNKKHVMVKMTIL